MSPESRQNFFQAFSLIELISDPYHLDLQKQKHQAAQGGLYWADSVSWPCTIRMRADVSKDDE